MLRSNWGRPVFASEAITVSTLIINIEVKNNFVKYNIFNFLNYILPIAYFATGKKIYYLECK